MFEIEKKFRFEAGHQLIHHDGQCSEPHGHSYVLLVTIRSDHIEPKGPKKNMVMDFNDISNVVKPMIDKYLDHKWLNDTLGTDSPTAEFIAKWIFDYLNDPLPNLDHVTLYETETSRVTYRRR